MAIRSNGGRGPLCFIGRAAAIGVPQGIVEYYELAYRHNTNSKQMAVLGLVASLAGLQRFMFREVVFKGALQLLSNRSK